MRKIDGRKELEGNSREGSGVGGDRGITDGQEFELLENHRCQRSKRFLCPQKDDITQNTHQRGERTCRVHFQLLCMAPSLRMEISRGNEGTKCRAGT